MICAELREGLWEQRTGHPDPLPVTWIYQLDLFSPLVFSLQSPRASCLPSLQACSRCGPPWAPFHLSHLPPAQERLWPLRPAVQVSPLDISQGMEAREAEGCQHLLTSCSCSSAALSRPNGAATTTAAAAASAPAPGSASSPEASPAPGFPFPPPWMGMPLPPPFGKWGLSRGGLGRWGVSGPG